VAALTVKVSRKQSGAGIDAWAAAFARSDDWLKALGELLREDVEQRFQTQTDPWGAAWAPHSAVTVALRNREGKPGRILIKDRYLANSFSYRIERLPHPRVIISSGGPSARYAAAQQFGNPNNKMFGRGRAPIPPRAMLPLRPSGKLDMPPRLLTEIRAELEAAIKIAMERFRAA
jgi:phage gpG-like protein